MPIPDRLTPAAFATLETRTHFHAICWKIVQRGTGTTIRLTEHPREIEAYPDGVTAELFDPIGVVESSARRAESELRSKNVDVKGFLKSDRITDADIRLGRYHRARITEYRFDYRAPFFPIKTDVYVVRMIGWTGYEWRFELDGLSSLLDRPRPEFWGPLCRAKLYSTGERGCNVVESSFKESVQVQSVVNRHTFTVNTTPQADDWWKDGEVYWTNTGSENAFTRQQVKSSSGTDGQTIELLTPTPFPVGIGDDLDISPGCNHASGAFDLVGDCRNKFDNLDNFQGEYLIPGFDHSTRGIVGL